MREHTQPERVPAASAGKNRVTEAAGLLFSLAGFIVLLTMAAQSPPAAYGDGNGSPPACFTAVDVDAEDTGQSEDEITYDAGPGEIVTYVCIKSGSNTFDGVTHSGPLSDGTYDYNGNPVANDSPAACYVVDGVGTDSVTVTRVAESSNCQGLSHVDIATGGGENPVLIVEKVCTLDPDAEETFGFNLDADSVQIDEFDLDCGEATAAIDLETDVDYEIVEEEPEEGWLLLSASCTGIQYGTTEGGVSFTPVDNEVIVCTFLNEDLRENPTLVIEKVCAPDEDADEAFGFDIEADGDQIEELNLECGESSETFDLEAGVEYEVIEEDPETGWVLTDITCTGIEFEETESGAIFTPEETEAIICTFTNEQEADNPTLVIEKVCEPEEDADEAFGFDIEADGDQIEELNLECGESSETFDLEAGVEYEVIEEDPETGWALIDITCTGIEFEETESGAIFTPEETEVIVCTFTNEEEPVEITTPVSTNTPTATPTAPVVIQSTPTATATSPASPTATSTPRGAADVAGVRTLPSTGSGGQGSGALYGWAIVALLLAGGGVLVIGSRLARERP